MVPARTLGVAVVAVLGFTGAGCSWGDDGVSATRSQQAGDGQVAAEMRPVPTTPSPDDTATDPIADDAEDLGPPVTEVLGDPQPDPDDPEQRPPLPPSPPVDPCERAGDAGVVDAMVAATAVTVAPSTIGDRVCRFAGLRVIAEIHFVPEGDIEGDWFRREGIEPVGEVGGDVVGVDGFVPPGSTPADGYTIALVERREGVIVAVRGTGDDRLVAVELAVLVASSI